MNEFVEQFLLESRELVAQAVDDLMALEDRPNDKESLDGAFRAFHTLKGAAGIVDFDAMARMLHAAEDILAALRESNTQIAPNVLDECLASLDLTSHWLDAMQSSGVAPSTANGEADAMIARLAGLHDAGEDGQREDDQRALSKPSIWLERLRAAAGDLVSGPHTALRYVPSADAFYQGYDPLKTVAALPRLVVMDLALTDPVSTLDTMNAFNCGLEIFALIDATAAEVRSAIEGAPGRSEIIELLLQATATPQGNPPSKAMTLLEAQLSILREPELHGLVGRIAAAGRTAANALLYLRRADLAADVDRATVTAQAELTIAPLVSVIERALRDVSPSESPARGEDIVQPVAPRALRVDMERVDAMVKLTGELIVVKNAIGHLSKLLQASQDSAAAVATLREQHALFDRLAMELQSAVLRIRVLPLRSVFRRFPRLVREMAGSIGKTVRLVTEGDGTEADATIVDALFEPLLHVLRNAVDHGIEPPDQRAAAGKPAMGTIVLRAARDADTVRIEVADDGGGIDVDRVRAVARARGVASEEALTAMTDAEAIELVFAPGFSTAAAVSDLSGRGVGMDSVKTAIERLGGRVTLESRPGARTIVGLILPFSLMMTRIMTVEVSGQAFGLPLDGVLETTIIDRERIASIGAGRAFVLRDRTVPLINLADTLGIARDDTCRSQAKIVILQSAGQIGGVEVDRLGERMDVMLTPMDGLLGSMKGVAGTTLLGDGRVLIVLDAEELFT
jgi:two-component system, chemotaxis family, sensor kinase CheA